jgi:hypothetical protein
MPESIQKLSNLKELYLSVNYIEIIPNNIRHLFHLEILSMDNNQLKVLPEVIGNLINLRVLSLNFNKIKTIPQSITGLTALKRIDLNYNEDLIIPSYFIDFIHENPHIVFYIEPQTIPPSFETAVKIWVSNEYSKINNFLINPGRSSRDRNTIIDESAGNTYLIEDTIDALEEGMIPFGEMKGDLLTIFNNYGKYQNVFYRGGTNSDKPTQSYIKETFVSISTLAKEAIVFMSKKVPCCLYSYAEDDIDDDVKCLVASLSENEILLEPRCYFEYLRTSTQTFFEKEYTVYHYRIHRFREGIPLYNALNPPRVGGKKKKTRKLYKKVLKVKHSKKQKKY